MDGYYSAAVCRRGHVAESLLGAQTYAWETPAAPPPAKCSTCGANVLVECPNCGYRLRGDSRGGLGSVFVPNDFCDKCGAPMPWASRAARLWELENLLGDEDISEADQLSV